MTATQLYTGTLVVETCPTCHVIHGVPRDMIDRAHADHSRGVYCPNGHRWVYIGKTTAQKERERAELAERRLGWAEARANRIDLERQAEANRARTLKGHVTRLRNRIAAGVCPVQSCRRNFANVREHIASEHPAWAHDHPDALT